MYIVSACLLGKKCRYNGEDCFTPWVKQFAERTDIIPLCPENLGGLKTPRRPIEYEVGKKIYLDITGKDCTEEIRRGAEKALLIAKETAVLKNKVIKGAILKSKSPSCGKDLIYDGSFKGILTNGRGEFARLVEEEGIKIITEKDGLKSFEEDF